MTGEDSEEDLKSNDTFDLVISNFDLICGTCMSSPKYHRPVWVRMGWNWPVEGEESRALVKLSFLKTANYYAGIEKPVICLGVVLPNDQRNARKGGWC